MTSFNPSEPNTTREIKFLYVTDENGDLSISIESEGFEGGEEWVALFIQKTVETIANLGNPNNTDK